MAKRTKNSPDEIANSIKIPQQIYRKPSQTRGIAQFQNILQAAQRVIEESMDGSKELKTISLYHVAKKAEVSTGSVYHFFPNMEAIYSALVEHYDEKFAEIIRHAIDNEGTTDTWKDILVIHTETCREFMNSHPAALWLIIGPGRTWQSRQVDTIGDLLIAQSMLASYSDSFSLPTSPKPETILHYAIRILEGFWELSYQLSGHVSKDMSAEANRAMIAYISLYWPLYLEKA
jgi:AcrR family transcriptional regulator